MRKWSYGGAKVVTLTVAGGAVARNDSRDSTFLLCEIAGGRSDGHAVNNCCSRGCLLSATSTMCWVR